MNYSLLRRLSAGEVCAALLATMTACGGGSSAPAADSADSSADGGTVKVGLLHSLTGSMAISEMSVRDAEVLAIDEINKAGGVNGCQIAYVEEDGASQPSTFAAKAEKLIDSDGVATSVRGSFSSSRVWVRAEASPLRPFSTACISAAKGPLKPIVEDYDALLWYPVQYEGMESSPNIVYTGAAPNQQIVPAIEYLLDKGYKNFFLLGSDYVFPRTVNMIIEAQVKAAGANVVGEEYADMDQTDFAAIIAKIEAAKPDIIINTLNGTGNVSFFKQMSEKNYTAETYPTMSFSIAEEEAATIGADILKGHMVS